MRLFSKRYVAQYPRGVATLFCTFALLMVSSASFLGVFVLYLTQALHFSDARAYSLFSSFLSLLAILAVAGGYLGGRLLSHRSAVWVGYLLMFLGLLLLGFDGKHIIHFSLSCYALGASLVMPNGMYLLGQLYKPGDSRKNSGFTLIYTGLNVGALLGFLVSSYLAHDISYSFCFKIAALAPLAAILILSLNFSQFQRDQKFTLGNYVIFGGVLVALLLLIFACLSGKSMFRFGIGASACP